MASPSDLRTVASQPSPSSTPLDMAKALQKEFGPRNDWKPWPQKFRAIPNLLLRTSLFGVHNRRTFRGNIELFIYKNRELLGSNTNLTVYFTGRPFKNIDFEVWAQILHEARFQPLGSTVNVRERSLLVSLGKNPRGGSGGRQLKEAITQLKSSTFEITRNGKEIEHHRSLIERFDYDKTKKEYVITLSEELLFLYGEGYTLIDWEMHQSLKGDLTKWLYRFYASHRKPYPMKVETLMHLSGSESKTPKKSRDMLIDALKKLESVGLLETWEITPTRNVCVIKQVKKKYIKHNRPSSTFTALGKTG